MQKTLTSGIWADETNFINWWVCAQKEIDLPAGEIKRTLVAVVCRATKVAAAAAFN